MRASVLLVSARAGTTGTSAALNMAADIFQSDQRQGIKNIIVLITDGQPSETINGGPDLPLVSQAVSVYHRPTSTAVKTCPSSPKQ